MNLFKRNLLWVMLFFQALSSFNCLALTDITADHKGYLYTGRIDFANVQQPYLSWPGTSIKAEFTGNELVVIFDDEQGKNYFNVILNGQDLFPVVLELKQGKHEYNLSHMLFNNNKLSNTVELFKRTEGHEGGTKFLGLKLADTAKLLPAPQRLNRKIAFFGDSITSGMGNEAADNAKDNVGAEKNHYWSYAAITARNLQAEHHTISSSGIGFMVSWFDHIMPQVYDQISGVGNNDTQWNFNQWQPDVVVVNLGQNDSWLIDNEKRLQPAPTDDEIITAYKNFILSLRKVYPKAQFVLALGSMDATKPERIKWVNYVKTAMADINKLDSTANIDLVLFDFTGYAPHPRIQQHINNAGTLTQYIKKIMHW